MSWVYQICQSQVLKLINCYNLTAFYILVVYVCEHTRYIYNHNGTKFDGVLNKKKFFVSIYRPSRKSSIYYYFFYVFVIWLRLKCEKNEEEWLHKTILLITLNKLHTKISKRHFLRTKSGIHNNALCSSSLSKSNMLPTLWYDDALIETSLL